MSVVAAGIDPSTYTGTVGLDGQGWITKLVTFPKDRGMRRVQLIGQVLGNLMAEWRPQVVCIEGYAYGNVNTLVTLTEIGTGIRLALQALKIPWYDVPPTLLKKVTTGRGNAKKSDMAAAVKERWGFFSNSDDVVDAFALAKMAEQIAVEGAVPINWKGVQINEYH